MKQIILAALLFVQFASYAQGKPASNKPVFQSVNQVGVLEGAEGTALHLQTVNGFRLNKVFLGLGVGLDYYKLRSIPLFLDMRKYLLRSGNMFLYGDGGLHFPWEGKSFDWPSTYQPGLYYDLGLGYRVPLKGYGIQLSAGYTYKAYTQEQRFPDFCFMPPCEEQVISTRYQLRRIAVKMGVSF